MGGSSHIHEEEIGQTELNGSVEHVDPTVVCRPVPRHVSLTFVLCQNTALITCLTVTMEYQGAARGLKVQSIREGRQEWYRNGSLRKWVTLCLQSEVQGDACWGSVSRYPAQNHIPHRMALTIVKAAPPLFIDPI